MACVKCGACCEYYNGLITVSDEEYKNYEMMKRNDIINHLKKEGKYYLAWYNNGKKMIKCPFLINNECSIHEIKPLMCKRFKCDESGFLRALLYK